MSWRFIEGITILPQCPKDVLNVHIRQYSLWKVLFKIRKIYLQNVQYTCDIPWRNEQLSSIHIITCEVTSYENKIKILVDRHTCSYIVTIDIYTFFYYFREIGLWVWTCKPGPECCHADPDQSRTASTYSPKHKLYIQL